MLNYHLDTISLYSFYATVYLVPGTRYYAQLMAEITEMSAFRFHTLFSANVPC